MEVPAQPPAVPGLSVSAILEVAEGLRWTDPQLSVALAEHAARAAAGDAGVRSAAERSAVLALGRSDRAAELVLRALPHLREAERDGRAADAAVLRCELARAAVRCGDPDAAEALLEPLAGGRVLPPTARADALIAWGAARAARGDVAGVDAATRQVQEIVGKPGDARGTAIQRSRAEARRVAGDAAGALEVLRAVAPEGDGADGGREAAMVAADHVEVLVELGRLDEAREVARPALAFASGATTALALGRLRCVLARRVHLAAGDLDTAESLAREAETDLTAAGHEAQVAEAVEVLADVAGRRGETGRAVEELRRAQEHATAAREETTRARIALAVALASPDDRLPAPQPVDEHSTGTESGDASSTLPGAVSPSAAGFSAREAVDALRSALMGSASGSDLDSSSLPELGAAAPTPATSWTSATWDPTPLGSPAGGEPTGAAPREDPPPHAALSAALREGAEPDVTSARDEPAASSAADREPHAGEEVTPASVGSTSRRRRGRYREKAEPDGPLAEALAAARAELEAISAAPAPSGADPGRDGPEERTKRPEGEHDAIDLAAAARSRRLERARARWEASDSWLSRRDQNPARPAGGGEGGSTDEAPAGTDGPLRGPLGVAAASSESRAGGSRHRSSDSDASALHPGADHARGDGSPHRPGQDGDPGDADLDASDLDASDLDASGGRHGHRGSGEPAPPRAARATYPADDGRRAEDALATVRNGAHGTGAGGSLTDGPLTDGPLTRGALVDGPLTQEPFAWGSPADKGPLTNGSLTNGPLTNGPLTNGPLTNGPLANGTLTNGALAEGPSPRAQEAHREAGRSARSRDDDHTTALAAGWEGVLGTGGTGTAGPGADDEWADELALTLVDLLSEYQDPGVPLGTAHSMPTPASPPRVVSRAPSRPSRPSRESTPGRQRPNGRSAPEAGGVPSARRSEVAGPRLADLLAEAMDAYHSAGPGGAPADDHRARR